MTPQRERIARGALRAVAILIAIGGVWDPVFSIDRTLLVEVGVVVSVLPEHRAAAADAVRALEVPGKKEVAACAADQPCVIVTDGASRIEVAADRRAATSVVHVAESATSNVRLVQAFADPFQHLYASGVVHVVIDGRGVTGQRTEIEIKDGKAIVGVGAVEWKQDGRQQLDVQWWPIISGGRQLSVEAAATGGEGERFDNVIDVGVDVRVDRFRALVFEPRPSWSTTFVRRALEHDARFTVDHRSRLGPAITAGTVASGLDRDSLDRADLVVIGAPDALTSSEVDLLGQYVQVRGGSLFLVPDRAPAGPALRLFGNGWKELLLADARQAGALRASELLIARGVAPLDTIVAGTADEALVISRASGRGRLLLSGMMDAWRFRGLDDDGFDRFWQRVGADAASRGTQLSVEIDQPLAMVGARVPFRVRWRSMAGVGVQSVQASMRCTNGPLEVLRLWPTGEPDVFEGTAVASQPWGCRIDARAGRESTSASFPSVTSPRFSVANNLAALDPPTLAQRQASPGATAPERPSAEKASPMHPMHSAFWMFPFVVALGGEWWLRRRIGLR